MATVKCIRLGWHKASGQHTKWVGNAWTKDGRLTPYCFYLGTDESKALSTALDLQRQWKELKAKGEAAWASDFLAKFNGKIDTASLAAPLTISQASEKYLAHLEQRQVSGQITERYVRDERWRLGKALAFLNAERPMRTLDEKALSKAVLAICGRPHEWSALYAAQILKSFKWFLNWGHDGEQWDKPRNYDRIFKGNAPKLTLKEQSEALTTPEAAYLTTDELKALWGGCKLPLEKAVFLLGLQCGFCTSECSTLRNAEIRWGSNGEATYIERLRTKTGVYARYRLWDETADALRNAASKGEWALTYWGHPLVEGVTDSLRVVWRNIRKASGIDKPFKLLRKTAARTVKKIGGLEVSEMMLAHAEGGINKHYSGRNWEALDKAIISMRSELQTMFAVDAPKLQLSEAA